MSKITVEQKIPSFMLQEWQSDSLEQKIKRSKMRIKHFYDHMGGKVYVAFSGGKDSQVLLHLIRSIYPDVEAVFFDTGVEFPEIHKVIRATKNVTIVHPTKTFQEIISEWGYPVISKQIALKVEAVRRSPNNATARYYTTGYKKDGTYKKAGMISKKWMKLIDAPFKVSWKCCNHLKKYPVERYIKKSGKRPFIGNMASESRQRKALFLKNGCSVFKKGKEQSTPLAFWLESDVWAYIKKFDLKYCELYDKGWDRTGCMFCLFGIHMEKKLNRIQNLQKYNPKLHKYALDVLGVREIMNFIGLPHSVNEHFIRKRESKME